MSDLCEAPHPNFVGVTCRLPASSHPTHIPHGYVAWDASSPQPWANEHFIMPTKGSTEQEAAATTLHVAQRLEPAFARAHRNDPDTSHDAAKSVGDLRENMALVLRVIATYGPLTQDTVHGICCEENGEDWNEKAHSSYRSLVSELKKQGLVRDSGLRGLSDLKNTAVKYEATEQGLALLQTAMRLPV